MIPKIKMYTDGSYSGKHDLGGWSAYVTQEPFAKPYLLSGGEYEATNNRMELLAVIKGLESLGDEKHKVHVVTDSQYVQKAITNRWIYSWKKNNWKTATGKPVKNKDLWLRLEVLVKKHTVKAEWVKGHSGQPENELVDMSSREVSYHLHNHVEGNPQTEAATPKLKKFVKPKKNNKKAQHENNKVVQLIKELLATPNIGETLDAIVF